MNPKFDDVPSDQAYVVVHKDDLFAGPDIEEKETNGFNQRTVRTKVKEVKGTLKRKQDDAGRVGRKEYEKLREGYEKVRKGLIVTPS